MTNFNDPRCRYRSTYNIPVIRASRRRPESSVSAKAMRVLPCLGVIEPADHGQWTARTFGGVELGSFRFRSEAGEALLVHATSGT